MALTRTRKRLIKKIAVVCAAALVLFCGVFFTVKIVKNQEYNPDKFNSTSLSCSGGEQLDNIDLSLVKYDAPQEGQTEINLSFSLDNGENISGVPAYTVDFIPSPLRMRIALSGVNYWDYVVSGITADTTGTVAGMFQQSPMGENDKTYLYFNLARDVKFKVTENDGALSVLLESAKETESQNGAYILADMYYEYQMGEMPDDTFTPTLSSDGVSVITVSKMYSDIRAAQQDADKLLAGAYAGRELRVVEGNRFSLLSMGEQSDTLSVLNESVLSVDGAKTTLTPFYSDARFLCWLPGNSGALLAKSEENGEKLYACDRTGAKHAVTEKAFSTVVKASVSADGKVIVFVEHGEETELLTALFTESGEIKTFGEGRENISGIAVNSDGSRLYCLSGTDTYVLSEYNTVTGEERILSDKLLIETELFYHAGYLYYCDIVEEYEAVVRNYARDNSIEVIARGSQFAVSADGNVVAVVKEDYDTAVSDLNIVNVKEKTVETVYHDVVLSEFFISSDNSYLYYIVETGDSEFYYQIMKYDIAKKEITTLAQSVNASFFASVMPDEIVISLTYNDEGVVHPVTYIADFIKINEAIKNEIEQTE